MKLKTIESRLMTAFPRLDRNTATTLFMLLGDRFGLAYTYWDTNDLKDRGVKGDDEHLRDIIRRFSDKGMDGVAEAGNLVLDAWLSMQDDVEFGEEGEEDE